MEYIEGVVTLKDLCSENGCLLSFEEFKLKYRNIKCTFICYYGLLKAMERGSNEMATCPS